ncbi:TIR domain-containing protein [[Mycobacterium] burgundiense]|uniref:TIR domain-containing protein n=1 Tax=[Mycobacterium] burgundiense TaxID=3064286 RepID=A0ABN9NBM8_9MYCO|nr:TIR domain-containing protein [Mycolicibacterium sp. MU0053]CAJ1503748.1 TIR domain-containing protein [Mycolicibacterium sp. MU0053]
MARRAFFSFHYERDIWRANVVRNSWVTQNREAAGYFDASLWEEAKKKGDGAIKAMIDSALINTSVTVVLVGQETASRTYVKYEIERSIARGNGLLGIRIEKIEDRFGNTDTAGLNPLPTSYPLYRWNMDNGYLNMGAWIEAAATKAGR